MRPEPSSRVSRDPDVFVHPQGVCESRSVGRGTRIWAFAHVMDGARVGTDCNICNNVFIEAGAIVGDRVTIKNNVMVWDRIVVEDDVFLGPNIVLTNERTPRAAFKKPADQLIPTLIREGATIGANATIICGVTIGRWAFIGAGAVVTRTVPDHALVYGNPARLKAWMCVCGEKLPESLVCGACATAFEQNGEEGLRARVR